MKVEKSLKGRQPNQKIKPYIVLQYLLKYTDEDNPVTAYEIVEYLKDCGIYAERRSIYRDIEEINKALLMLEEGCSIDEAEEMIGDDETLKTVVYKPRKGFYVQQRHYDLNDIRLLAECVYAAKFIPQGQANRLSDIVCEFVSEQQAEKIKHDAVVVDRVKTLNKSVLNNISLLRDAMSRQLDGEPHTPEKVTFSYLTHEIGDVEKLVERHRKYKVSPYHLIINDGNYYLLSFDDTSQEMRTYRVDRMKNLSFTNEPREGAEVFKTLDLDTYTQRVFGMFGGEKKKVQLTFTNGLLDTAIDRFGTKNAFYAKKDDRHFIVITDIEISNQFFAWVSGFGRRIKIETPEVAEQYKDYLDKIRSMY
ncbi:MAG: WYL domain-containing protein [Firmicutes bacterium]|nr:WYL domain-containing protein [Bacillota bacterium]